MKAPPKGCLRCDGTNWFRYGHWHICRDCSADFVASIEADLSVPMFKPELFDKGLPSKPGGK